MEAMRTPKKPFDRLLTSSVMIPASPAMHCIGLGTGVNVYSLERSPVCGQFRSPWAIKKVNRRVVAPEYEKRLVTEADILRSLKHPNIVGFRAFIEAKDGRKCLAMEECESSLGGMIEERSEGLGGPFPVGNIMTVTTDICKALRYLHDECLILHGDIKSFNVLIKGDFEVAKLCDFGVIVRLNSTGSALPGQKYVGTECWWAPEVLEDEDGTVTTKADIFAYGLMLWEMLALRPPHSPEDFPDDSEEPENSVLEDVFGDIGTRPDLPAGLGPDYDEVVMVFNWCCEEDIDARPSAAQLLRYLEMLGEK